MPARRGACWIGFGACAAALAFAFYAQYGLGLVPCHLCIFQRVTLAAMGAAFLVAALLPDGRRLQALGAALIGLTGLATIATAGRHVWIQMQPAGSVAPCGADLEFMLDIFPLTDVILKVFKAGGECAKVDWTLLGLSMPAWVLLFAVAVTAAGMRANLRRS
jgi:disulfide bond formation protein DsbB